MTRPTTPSGEITGRPSFTPSRVPRLIRIVRKGEDTVEEYRVNGQLYMIKVTPPHGVPYYLYDDVGNGDFTRRDAQDAGVRVPKWVIKRW